MNPRTQSTLEHLQFALHGVTSAFSCSGTIDPDAPATLAFKNRTQVEVIRAKNSYGQEQELKALLDRCKPAPFGEGKKTRYDRRVRDAFQLKAEKDGFRFATFDPKSAGVLEAIQRQLLPNDPNPITAELDTLNIYTYGGHFAPHKDTPRGPDMLGTLVVCLPSQFWGGQLVLNHRGVVQRFDWGHAIGEQKQPDRLHWAAFFGDVDHRIDIVRSGCRVTVTYLLRRGAGGGAGSHEPNEVDEPRIREAWSALLADRGFLPEGGILAYPCCHLYHQAARFQEKQDPLTRESSAGLKGRDHLAAISALQAGLNVTFQPYLFENCVNETWQLDRFPTVKERARLGRQMDPDDLERVLALGPSSENEGFDVTWLESPPDSDDESQQPEPDSGLPVAAKLHSCEYSATGYFGNEGSEVDFYTYAALHFEIPPYGKRVLAPSTSIIKASTARRPPARRRKKKSD